MNDKEYIAGLEDRFKRVFSQRENAEHDFNELAEQYERFRNEIIQKIAFMQCELIISIPEAHHYNRVSLQALDLLLLCQRGIPPEYRRKRGLELG